MESGKIPGDNEDERQKSKSLQSKEQPKTMPSLMIKIPAEYLSERQKKLLCQKPQSKDEPSTSSEKKEDVFKVPWVPPLRKKEAAPSKASSEMDSTPLPTTMVQTDLGALEESIAPETVRDISLDKEAESESHDHNLN